MNKKAQIGLISSIIMLTIGVVFVAYLFIPQVQESTNTKDASDTLIHTANDTTNKTFTLENTPVVSGSLSISGLTLSTNYTVDYDTAVVTLLANYSATNNYTAIYEYTGSRYIDSTTDRALMGVLITVAIAGLLYWIARTLGLA